MHYCFANFDQLTILVDQPNNATAFAYEFEI
jgi:hypothetical protein